MMRLEDEKRISLAVHRISAIWKSGEFAISVILDGHREENLLTYKNHLKRDDDYAKLDGYIAQLESAALKR